MRHAVIQRRSYESSRISNRGSILRLKSLPSIEKQKNVIEEIAQRAGKT